MALIFAARQSSPGSSTVVFTVSLSVRFAATTVCSLSTQTAQRQDINPVIRLHSFTSRHLHMQLFLRFYGFTGQRDDWGQVTKITVWDDWGQVRYRPLSWGRVTP